MASRRGLQISLLVFSMSSDLSNVSSFDLVIAGGGLSGGLLALALHKARPEMKVALVEAGETVGGNHLWSSFESDLSDTANALVAPLVTHRWPATDVRFPNYARTLAGTYRTVSSAKLDAVVRAVPSLHVLTESRIAALYSDRVQLVTGEVLEAPTIVDARGQSLYRTLDLGWQKFLGQEVELEEPHGLAHPIIMDARVPQFGGYRFVYVLPFDERRCLIEDTYYTDGDQLDQATLRARIADYAKSKGWEIRQILREEHGVLPIAIGGDLRAYLKELPLEVVPLGMAAALFHPVTGYSFPDAAHMAVAIAENTNLQGEKLAEFVRIRASELWEGRRFYHLLNKMLFRAALPEERWKILERFYRLDAGLISRFYAGQSTGGDKLRILAGKPPVPIGRAIRALVRG